MPDPSPDSPSWGTLLGMGATIAGQLAVFVVLGLVVDAAAGTGPVFLLVGVLVGVLAAAVYTVVQFRKYLKT